MEQEDKDKAERSVLDLLALCARRKEQRKAAINSKDSPFCIANKDNTDLMKNEEIPETLDHVDAPLYPVAESTGELKLEHSQILLDVENSTQLDSDDDSN